MTKVIKTSTIELAADFEEIFDGANVEEATEKVQSQVKQTKAKVEKVVEKVKEDIADVKEVIEKLEAVVEDKPAPAKKKKRYYKPKTNKQ